MSSIGFAERTVWVFKTTDSFLAKRTPFRWQLVTLMN